MTREDSMVEAGVWLTQTPQGQCLLRWQQQALDAAVADVFGFHAVQMGLPEFAALRANRMPRRWLAASAVAPGVAVACEAAALPFADQSLDLLVLPHTLEHVADPHQALAEAARVVRPEGRVLITMLNPHGPWAWRDRGGDIKRRLGLGRRATPPFLPPHAPFITVRRLRDWLQLLSFDVEQEQFGGHGLPLRSMQALQGVGERLWPRWGAVYLMQAVKRVRGVRLVGLAQRLSPRPSVATAVAANRKLQRRLEGQGQDK